MRSSFPPPSPDDTQPIPAPTLPSFDPFFEPVPVSDSGFPIDLTHDPDDPPWLG
jgi:hypothetical protein